MKQMKLSKKEVARKLIGLPYQHHDYVGVYIPYKKEPTKVIAHIKNEKEQIITIWTFDSYVALEHAKEKGYITEQELENEPNEKERIINIINHFKEVILLCKTDMQKEYYEDEIKKYEETYKQIS